MVVRVDEPGGDDRRFQHGRPVGDLHAGRRSDRGDTAAADEYRCRKEAAQAEAEQRAGPQGLPQEMVVGLLQLALTARSQQLDLADALAGAGSNDPAELLAAIEQTAPWLAGHLKALASGSARPAADVPPS